MKLRVLACLAALLVLAMNAALAVAQQNNSRIDQGGKPERTITAVNAPATNAPQKAQQFIKEAAIDDAAEVSLGQMAQNKASNPAVKSFGQRMVRDHSKNDDLLMNLAAAQHMSLPNSLDQKHKNEKQQLSGLSGKKFDQAYMNLMVQAHTTAVNKFQQEANNAQDPMVKKYANETLPVLKSHLKEAKDVEAKVKNK